MVDAHASYFLHAKCEYARFIIARNSGPSNRRRKRCCHCTPHSPASVKQIHLSTCALQQVEFFTNEDGTHIEFNWEPDKEDWERQSINTISLTRTESTLSRRTMSERLGFRRRQSITGLPFHRTTTVDSTSSHWTEKSETRVDADLESVNEDFEYQSRDTMPLTRTGTAVSTASRRTLSERFCLPRALSLHRAPTMESILSWTTSYDFGTTMPLEHLIELVDKHPSLQRAEIPSTEGYWQISNGVIHRFLVLELQRQKQKPIWLRLDRRPDISAGMLKFVLDSAKAPANDTVRCASCP